MVHPDFHGDRRIPRANAGSRKSEIEMAEIIALLKMLNDSSRVTMPAAVVYDREEAAKVIEMLATMVRQDSWERGGK